MDLLHWLVHFLLLACLIFFMKDGLTFLWVRRCYNLAYHFFIRLGGQVILLDLDNLKKINDRFGHKAGDYILRKIGLVLLRMFPLRAFRWGGDEFAVLLPKATKQKAENFAKKIQREIEKIDINGAIRVKISIGIGSNEEEADKELYSVKLNRQPR